MLDIKNDDNYNSLISIFSEFELKAAAIKKIYIEDIVISGTKKNKITISREITELVNEMYNRKLDNIKNLFSELYDNKLKEDELKYLDGDDDIKYTPNGIELDNKIIKDIKEDAFQQYIKEIEDSKKNMIFGIVENIFRATGKQLTDRDKKIIEQRLKKAKG